MEGEVCRRAIGLPITGAAELRLQAAGDRDRRRIRRVRSEAGGERRRGDDGAKYRGGPTQGGLLGWRGGGAYHRVLAKRASCPESWDQCPCGQRPVRARWRG